MVTATATDPPVQAALGGPSANGLGSLTSVFDAAPTIISYNLSETALPLRDAWKPRKQSKDSPKWACAQLTHCQCNRWSAQACTDGCICKYCFSKVGDVHHSCALDPGCKVSDALSIVKTTAAECKLRVPTALGVFIILSDVSLPLCDDEDLARSAGNDEVCVASLNAYIEALRLYFQEVEVVAFDHHHQGRLDFLRLAPRARGGWSLHNVHSDGTLEYAEPSSWLAMNMGVAWEVPYSAEEIAVVFACAYGDAALMWKDACRDALRKEVTKHLGLSQLVTEEACLNAVAVVDRAGQNSDAAQRLHSLLKAMWSDQAVVAEVDAALESTNQEMLDAGGKVLAHLLGQVEGDASVTGELEKTLFQEAWEAGHDVTITGWSRRFRILDTKSAAFSRRVNRFLNEVCDGTDYIGAFFASPDPTKCGFASVRFSASFDAPGNSKNVLASDDHFLAKQLLASFASWDGEIIMKGHEDMVVLKRPAATLKRMAEHEVPA